ncbi:MULTISPECIES: tellurite resistance TerB family protein [Okeania]|uniref:tellurite resistance TerB family protein n=1 Tax=Okeania TaxID=1458928 RepID=UPI000F5288BC|nr:MULTISPECIES: tellurite resistance TerB family protein [Okeania]NES88460.1 tellurite resistance TerB family protein [Okeania sp. SIO2B9]NET78062.1 tellurite resistance TerB family protein [Okeania sp. SIO1F9]RQH21004.1 Tellurite resistance protein TerB [Okeania hirsuta]
MGLFDQGTTTIQATDIQLEPAEAFAAIALIAVAADGVITKSESQGINNIFSRMQLFSDYPKERKTEMQDRLLDMIKNQEIKPLFDAAVAKLPKELRETVFAVSTDLVLVDGDLAEEEEQLLNELYNALEISEAVATKIIDVIMIKNKG